MDFFKVAFTRDYVYTGEIISLLWEYKNFLNAERKITALMRLLLRHLKVLLYLSLLFIVISVKIYSFFVGKNVRKTVTIRFICKIYTVLL